LSNLHTHIIGCMLFIFPWASSKWVHIEFKWRRSNSLTNQTRFSNCAIFGRSIQRNTLCFAAPFIMRFKCDSIVYSRSHRSSLVSSSTWIEDAWLYTCRRSSNFVPRLFGHLLDYSWPGWSLPSLRCFHLPWTRRYRLTTKLLQIPYLWEHGGLFLHAKNPIDMAVLDPTPTIREGHLDLAGERSLPSSSTICRPNPPLVPLLDIILFRGSSIWPWM